MIASLRGTVNSVTLNYAVLEINGVGYLVYATPTVLSTLQVGSEHELHTHLVVREDALTLYGFAELSDRFAFEVLLGVPKVGPKVALAMLSVYSADELRQIVADKNYKALQQVPGIGAKSAQRIVLDIGEKLGAPVPGAGLGVASAIHPADETVSEALMGLGFSGAQANAAVREVRVQQPNLSTQELLREALKALRN
ncbi:Holliday junction branch migration protein RuvA [Boudabousia marimammalium]|uniref:Holliday junction branch migration complex subunit RuvA n=1 Tax=Boudabousia marimammalium TaxID=156892 RepID=A0A1Q5PQP7_9ACTO|nr:Holliday junction branch migration protein RuvA [Boudabousia marimammalium]OKL49968.1 Holliday junction DNA helicase RuvA [Boudabousia marimammalium]